MNFPNIMREEKICNQKAKPRITVLMSVYNGEKYLSEAIDSILNQTFIDFEFLIINDGSSDNSLQILKKYEVADSRIRIIDNEKNIGLAESLNKGLREAKCEYIARMDQDDISVSSRFAKQIKFMDANQDVAVCGTWLETFGTSKNIWVFPHTYELIKVNLMFNSCVVHPSVFIRSSFIERNKISYNSSFENAEDYDLWERIIYDYKGRIANLPEVLLYYRLHETSIGSVSGANQSNLADKIRLRQLGRLLGNNAEKYNDIHYRISKWEIRFNNEQLLSVKKYFSFLISENEKCLVYSPLSLNEELCNRFYNICSVNTHLGYKSYLIYISCEWVKKINIKNIKLFIKALFQK